VEWETAVVKKRSFSAPHFTHRPDLIVGAGHSVHLAMVMLAKRTGIPSVVIMKPSLPLFLFDLCIIPEHDLRQRSHPPHVLPTEGAMNRVPPPTNDLRRGGLILLGGPSSSHGWDSNKIRKCVEQIVRKNSDRPWRITDSRRTPEGLLDSLTEACPALVPFPWTDTGPEWLPQRLAEASETWVTEDSVSMIYETLSSGTRVGLLPVPRKAKATRVTRGVDRLVEQHWLTPYEKWNPEVALPEPLRTLREADRIAELVMDRFSIPRSATS
jgi:hypothetical protein